MDDFSFISSRDADEDESIAFQCRLYDARLEANICPNGCGSMTFHDPYNRMCPACGFVQTSNIPFDMKAGHA